MTLTKEQIEMYASAADATQTFEMDKSKLIAVEPEHVQELARIALASLEAEAVADVVAWSSQNEERTCDVRLRRHDIKPGPLYTAPPATVSVPAALDNDIDSDDHPLLWSYNNGWNAYRAAMLQGAVQPQNQQQNIPENIPVNTPCKEAPEYIWLQTAGVWPENGEFSELTWCSDNQHEDDTLYVRADVVSGNSPVITDGWVLVPVEPTAEMLQSGISAHYERNQIQIHDRPAPGPMECAYVAMLAAAPQQEVK